MSSKQLLFNENNLKIDDKKSFVYSNKSPETLIHGEVEIRDAFGNLLQRKSNIILLGGRRFVLEKIFNIEAPFSKKVTLNSLLNINEREHINPVPGPGQEKCVCLFGVGRGGSEISFGSIHTPAEKEFNLYDIIPMRYVSVREDLSAEEQSKYFLKKLSDDGEYNVYYLKKFESDPELVIKIDGEEYFPNIDTDNEPVNISRLIDRTDVEMYIQLHLKISAEDVREFFIATSNIDEARINELSVYFGYPSASDYAGVEAFSKITFNNEPLDDETKELDIIYKFFI